jgi:thiamine biosynthesis lipoprotein
MNTKLFEERVLVEHSSRIMDTDLQISLSVLPAEEMQAHLAVQSCLDWLHEVSWRLTRFAAESELSALNRAAGQWFSASEPLFAVVREAIAGARASAGLFDPALLGQLEALGYDRDFALLPRRAADSGQDPLPMITAGGGWCEIRLDSRRRRIRLPTGVRLDLGGIAKGWAADRALKRCFGGFANVLINVGGDLRLRGERQPGNLWAVGVADGRPVEEAGPVSEGIVLTLGRGGLATSGAAHTWWYQGGQRQHHLLDPRTGHPASLWLPADAAHPKTLASDPRLIASATALAPTAARAEVAAKVAMLRGYPAALQAVEAAWKRRNKQVPAAHTDAGVALLLILGTGEAHVSANMHEYLATTGAGGDLWL